MICATFVLVMFFTKSCAHIYYEVNHYPLRKPNACLPTLIMYLAMFFKIEVLWLILAF